MRIEERLGDYIKNQDKEWIEKTIEKLDKLGFKNAKTKDSSFDMGGMFFNIMYKNYHIQLKIFRSGSRYGLKNGPVSQVWIKDKDTNDVVANYSRSWDIKPETPELKDIIKKIEKLR